MRVLRFPLQRDLAMISGEHLSAADLATYIDGTLSDIARQRTERHLADCAQCREELAACAPLARSLPTTRRTRILASALGLAAAAVVGIAVLALPRSRSIDMPRERGTGPASREIEIVAPRPRSTVASNDLRFTWRADSGAAGYVVIVTTPTGKVEWKKEATDTSVAPPPDSTFAMGDLYWRVESTRVSGEMASSRPTPFRVVSR